MHFSLFPLLTEYDPAESSEGSLDPLGMYAIADSLAVQLVPGVRERQKRPRFLTIMAVSKALVQDYPEGTVSSDKKTEPWLVFEWHVVEGLVRTIQNREDLVGLPGVEKALDSLKKNLPLASERYLKTPLVFGMHGIYRRLAQELQLIKDDYLDEFGHELLGAWEKEQGQHGFYTSSGTVGRGTYKLLKEAINDGLKAGAVSRRNNWQGWDLIRDHLYHQKIGKREAGLISQKLLDVTGKFRKLVLEFLISESGQSILDKCRETGSEKPFHEQLIKIQDSSLHQILEAILSYEHFARLLQDAFNDCLYEMTQKKGKTNSEDLVSLTGVKKAVQEIPHAFAKAIDALLTFQHSALFQSRFGEFSENMNPTEWVITLLRHHQKIQRAKPPHGKAPWFEQFDDGTYIIRPAYFRKEGGKHNNSYVHFYRTWSLQSFAEDLRLTHG